MLIINDVVIAYTDDTGRWVIDWDAWERSVDEPDDRIEVIKCSHATQQ